MIKTSKPMSDSASVSTTQLAVLLDVSERGVRRLAARGIVVKVGYGRFSAAASARNYIRHLRQQAEARVGTDGLDMVKVNAEWKHASKQLLELRLQKEQREVIPVDQARDLWDGIVRYIRQVVLGLPGRIAGEVPTLTVHDRGVVL